MAQYKPVLTHGHRVQGVPGDEHPEWCTVAERVWTETNLLLAALSPSNTFWFETYNAAQQQQYNPVCERTRLWTAPTADGKHLHADFAVSPSISRFREENAACWIYGATSALITLKLQYRFAFSSCSFYCQSDTPRFPFRYPTYVSPCFALLWSPVDDSPLFFSPLVPASGARVRTRFVRVKKNAVFQRNRAVFVRRDRAYSK